MEFIWIDDNPDRETASKNLAKFLNVNCRFINVKGEDVGINLKFLLASEQPDLILIDHNLIDSVPAEASKEILIRRGSSAATIIRQQWKDCPIICISGMDANMLDTQEKAVYEEIYFDHKISSHYEEIISIARSFKLIKDHKPSDIADFLKLLACPESETEKLKSIIPTALKENFTDGGLVIEISNWVRKTLIARPGFLYDKLWTATLLGLTLDGFEKVEELFKEGKYTGVFAYDSSPRWWRSEIIKIVGQIVQVPGLPSLRGRSLPNINEDNYSECWVSKEPYPDTIAYLEDIRESKMVPMKLKETIVHPGFEKLLYFEELRLMAAPE
jgi:CheY-like chemotaxis protein